MFEYLEPTYVIRLSDTGLGLVDRVTERILPVLADAAHGASVDTGYGVWDGKVEAAVTVTLQTGSGLVLERVLDALATIAGITWVHVEKHEVPTAYVNLDERRPAVAS